MTKQEVTGDNLIRLADLENARDRARLKFAYQDGKRKFEESFLEDLLHEAKKGNVSRALSEAYEEAHSRLVRSDRFLATAQKRLTRANSNLRSFRRNLEAGGYRDGP